MEEKINKIKNQDLNLKSMTTIEKVLMLQRLLKELKFRKKAFLDTKEKMYSEIDKNLNQYFNGKIYAKRIFDHILNDDGKNNKYELYQGDKTNLKDLYEPFYNFLFLLQNDNSLMIKLIQLCKNQNSYYKPLSEFLVHFFYVDIINCSFNEDRLILLIYLLLEKQILSDNVEENNNNSLAYSKDNILYHIFESMTRKIDIRNFLGNILNKYILTIENLRTTLSFNLDTVNQNSNLTGRHLYQRFISTYNFPLENDIHSKEKLFTKSKELSEFNTKNHKKENKFIKRASKLTSSVIKYIDDQNKDTQEIENDDINQNEKLESSDKQTVEFKKRETTENNENNEPKVEKEEKEKEKKNKLDINFDDLNIKKKTLSNNKKEEKNTYEDGNIVFDYLNLFQGKTDVFTINKINDISMNSEGNIKIDKFFQDNDITKEKITKILDEYTNKDNINKNIKYAMIEYLNNLLTELAENKKSKKSKDEDNNEEKSDDKEDGGKFSSSLIIADLFSRAKNQNEGSFIQLMQKIIIIHYIITKTITDIINEISKNISNFPYSIKCIFKMIDILLDKKHNKDNPSYLKNYLFKASFLIGNIIIPIIKNPNYNGIISNIISDTTKENLEIIYNIFDTMVTGKLFVKSDKKEILSRPLYNKFIIETLPKIFEFIDNFEKNFELPDFINRLVNSIDNKDIHEKNINYDYFKEKPNESIQSQTLCFSLENLYIFSNIIGVNEKILIDENKNIVEQKILKEIVRIIKKTKFIEKYAKEKEEGKIKYFYFRKILYNNEIEKILKTISVSELNKNKDDLIKTFKNCLVEILSYENFDYLTEFNNLKTSNLNKNKNLKVRRKTALRSSLIKTLESVDKDDASFKDVIFPKIENNLIFEMNSNIDNQLIIFCTNYLKLNMKKLDAKYYSENYSLLFDELIMETKNTIQLLSSDILFEHYKKINEAEKINILESKYKSQIKYLEKLQYTEYLYSTILLPYQFIIERDEKDIITNIKYSSENKKGKIEEMIYNFPDFRKYDDILDIEKKAKVPEAIKEYFSEIKNKINNEELFDGLEEKEKNSIAFDLENYILNKLYDKLFPTQRSESDISIYEKCEKLSNIKPEKLIDKKAIINETLLKEASKYFEQLDEGITPKDKIKFIRGGLRIIENLITFGTGKLLSGSDDIYPPLMYSMIIAKVKNLPTNVEYINMFLDKNICEDLDIVACFNLTVALAYIEKVSEVE